MANEQKNGHPARDLSATAAEETQEPAVSGGPPKVSVVVPVYNPGADIGELITSLLRQSMPKTDWEAIFVDDGSTDGTGARLDTLAAEQDNITVVHIPNSGWPSRPRNIGIDRARGEYVQFADNDDWLGDEALERLYAYAKENDADVVIGKMAGRGRNVPRELFRHNRPDATLAADPLIDSLTPHKMFRRSFLLKHGLRFPEGKRRLEDHVFVTAAYFAADRISVLSDYVCYFHVARADASNAGFRRFDPAGYFGNVREALDIVDANTEPGALRDRLHRRWLRVEMVARLTAARYLDAPAEWRADFFREVRSVVTERFAPGVAAGLPAPQRAVVALVVQGRADELAELGRWEAAIRAKATARVTGKDEVTVEAELIGPDGPLTYTHEGGADLLRLPVGGIPPEALDVTDRLNKARLDVVARRRGGGGEEFFLPGTSTAKRVPVDGSSSSGDDGGDTDGAFRLVQQSVARLAPDTINAGRKGGSWELKARIVNCGRQKETELPVSLTVPQDGAPPVLRAGVRPPLLLRVRRRVLRARGALNRRT
ncbi:glycosyltransferase family 2 protein [Streptomyces sp. NBC_00370]|uniref:glycosyltransferase family 2 protein n=1 Tax=Streptomyces sp. NBC_00370 TaxID=2975728 RepID=UPI002E25E57E